MEKKHIIYFIITICLCIASFCYGRYRTGINGICGELESRIIFTRDETDKILDKLNLTRLAGNSATELGQAIIDGIGELQQTNAKQRVCLDAIIREVEFTEENAKIIKSALNGANDAMDVGFQLAIEDARAYETIVGTLREANEYTPKNE